MYTSTVQSDLSYAKAALSPHPRFQTSYPPSTYTVSSPSAPHYRPLLLAVFLHLPPPPDSLRILQWNAVGLQARSTELLHFLLSHPVDLICIQESNLNSSFSLQIPGFSALHSDCTHSWSRILSPDAMHASDGIIFLSARAYFSLNSLNPPFLCLTPTLIT